MTSDVEPAKKILLPYLQRADELQKHEPLVAYYCRLYAMERGLQIPVKERTKTTNAILVSLMNQLEKDKKTVQLSTEDNLYVEGFALNVFAKADKQDRAGRADLNTAKTFYAASIFIEILHQFGQLQPDIEQKQKYAVWKAADIRKALSEGRKPVPGPPGGDDDLLASHELLDSEVSPQSAAPVELQGRSSIQHEANAAFEIPASSLDGASKMNTSPPTHHDHQYASIPDQRTGEQPTPDFAGSSGYASGYPGSYHQAPSMPGYTPSSMASSHHGSMDAFSGYQGSLDGFSDGQHHSAALHKDYLQTSISGQMYSGVPTGYIAANGAADGGYYQHQGHAPSMVAYPTSSTVAYPSSAPFSADYSSIVGSSDLSGLARTTSAPTSSVKVQDYQPTPEKIAEAQKAARFAVSALAFDDVVTAVSYLKQSLELLTSPAST